MKTPQVLHPSELVNFLLERASKLEKEAFQKLPNFIGAVYLVAADFTLEKAILVEKSQKINDFTTVDNIANFYGFTVVPW